MKNLLSVDQASGKVKEISDEIRANFGMVSNF